MSGRIREEWNERKVLDERARPTVSEYQRNATTAWRSCVHEVDANAIDLDAELRQFPESLLLSAPVESLGPIVHQIPQPFEIRPLRPWSAGCAIRPTRVPNACLKI